METSNKHVCKSMDHTISRNGRCSEENSHTDLKGVTWDDACI